MATISKITTTYIDGTTIITSSLLGEFKSKINDIIDELNSSSTPTPVSNVMISTSVTPTGSGSVTGGGSYAPGASVTLTATAASGYTFSSWSDGNTNATRSITVGNSNLTYTATFAAISTPTVAAPTITIAGNSCTMSAENGATIYYTLNDSAPTTSSTQYSSAITLQSACTVKAIAVKNGVQSSVATQSYTPSVQPDADATAIMARYSKSLTSDQQSAFNAFIVGLKNAGIYDKIVYMVVPVLANDLTEATQNALTGESAFNNTITSSNVSFANGGISPVVGGSKAQIITTYGENDTQFENRNFHMSGYNVNVLTDTEYNEAQDLLLGGLYMAAGKSSERGYKAGVRYFTAQDDSTMIRLETSADTSVCKNKNHIVASFDAEKVIFSIHGTSNVSNQPVVALQVYQAKRPRLGEHSQTSNDVYTDPTSVELPLGGASRCKYGFISWGFALTETQCVAFNTCVETMMQAFV